MRGVAIFYLAAILKYASPLPSDADPSRLHENFRARRNAAPNVGSDNIGNPNNDTWICKAELGASCTFRMPVTLSISDFLPSSKSISKSMQRTLVMEAAKKWQDVTRDLTFAWAAEGQQGNIDVRFAFIDGPRGAIGRAANPSPQTPEPTWVRLDDAENWVTHDNPDRERKGEYSLQWALLHELGHAIGLRHSSNRNDIMFSELQETRAILSVGDIIAAQAFYGDFTVAAGNTGTTTQAQPTSDSGGHIFLNNVVASESPSQRPIGGGATSSAQASGIIVGNLPPNVPRTESSVAPPVEVPQGTGGQSVGRSGLIITDDPEPTQAPVRRSGGRAQNNGSRRKRARKCTKRRQRNNKCKQENTSKNKQRTEVGLASKGKRKRKIPTVTTAATKNNLNGLRENIRKTMRQMTNRR